MKEIKFKVVGRDSLLMHSDRYSNPLDELTKQHKALTSIKNKTDENHQAILRSEWLGSLYYDEKVGVYVPGDNFYASLVEGAKQDKLGKTFTRSVILSLESAKCPLDYRGKTSVKNMQEKIEDYSFTKAVVVSRKRIMRIRPKFDDWSFHCSLWYDEDLVNRKAIIVAAQKAGERVGLCDWRPRYGRYDVEVVE